MSISLCMIVRDEVESIGLCLESASGLADEVVAVDTGSTVGMHRWPRARRRRRSQSCGRPMPA